MVAEGLAEAGWLAAVRTVELAGGKVVTGKPAGRLAVVATFTGTDTGVVADGAVASGMVATTVGGVDGVVAGLMVVVARMMAATVVTARKTGIGRV